MHLRWIGPAGLSLEGYPCRDHDEPDDERIRTALASGLFAADEPAAPSKPKGGDR